MNLFDEKTVTNEKIIYKTKHHWAVLLGPIFIILIGWLSLKSQGYPAIALIAFGLIWGFFSYISLNRSEFALTKNSLLIDVGFPLKRFYDISLNDISYIDFYQPSLGSILNFGKVVLVYGGKKKKAFRFVAGPALFVKEVQEQVAAFRNKEKPLKTKSKKKA